MHTQESTTEPQTVATGNGDIYRRIVTIFASVKMTIALMTLIATSVLIGAWCPQEAAQGQEKIIETFGEQMALNLIQWGIADIFHSPFFLALIGLLTLNMVACSFQRVFPKIRSLKHPMPFIGSTEIGRLPFNEKAKVEPSAFETLIRMLRKQGYVVRIEGEKTAGNGNLKRLTGEFGKFGRLAATITHIGLLTLLVGVTITSWTGFNGFKPIRLGGDLSFKDSEHSKLWIGKLPDWRVHVDDTKRVDYPTGEAMQWYSDLTVLSPTGQKLAHKQISVNEPLTYEGVDVYQSSWGLDKLAISFNDSKRELQLQQMGKKYAAFLPLDQNTVFIFSLKNQVEPLRVFAKRPEWQAPKLLAQIKPGESTNLGAVKLTYNGAIPMTGLQYKSDPGLPITYVAFGFIMLGVMLAAVPHRHVWTTYDPTNNILAIGGRSVKAKVGFERSMKKLIECLLNEHGIGLGADRLHEIGDIERSETSQFDIPDVETPLLSSSGSITGKLPANDSQVNFGNVVGESFENSIDSIQPKENKEPVAAHAKKETEVIT